MNKLLILHTSFGQKTIICTKYYQLTNYFVDQTKLLFLHRRTTILYITFHYSTLHIYSKLLLSYYQTTILETEKVYWITYKQKSTFES